MVSAGAEGWRSVVVGEKPPRGEFIFFGQLFVGSERVLIILKCSYTRRRCRAEVDTLAPEPRSSCDARNTKLPVIEHRALRGWQVKVGQGHGVHLRGCTASPKKRPR